MKKIKYYSFCTKDTRNFNSIFYHHNDGKFLLRECYFDLLCKKCGKFDEIKSIKRGLAECDIHEKKVDMFGTEEGLICVSKRLKSILENAGVKHLDYYFAPSARAAEYFIIIPTRAIPVNKQCYQFTKKCNICGRYESVNGWPSSLEMELPQEPLAICIPDIPNEKPSGLYFDYMASEDVIKLLKAEKITGVQAVRIYP